MKTIEQQLDEMLPEDFKRRRRLAAARIKYFESMTAGLWKIARAGLTAEQAARNLNANLRELRKQNQSDNGALDNKP